MVPSLTPIRPPFPPKVGSQMHRPRATSWRVLPPGEYDRRRMLPFAKLLSPCYLLLIITADDDIYSERTVNNNAVKTCETDGKYVIQRMRREAVALHFRWSCTEAEPCVQIVWGGVSTGTHVRRSQLSSTSGCTVQGSGSVSTPTSSYSSYPLCFDAHGCHMGTTIEHPVPDRVKP